MAIGLVGLALAALTVATSVASAQAVSNGGARQWIAFDPRGRNLGEVQFLQKVINIVNTSTAPNKFAIFYEPQHIAFCSGTLGPGATTICGTQPNQRFPGGYFQVIADQPVLMGGYSDVPVMRYAQQGTQAFGADPSTGVVQYVPFVWQPGCPPRPGSGCPTGSIVGGGRGGVEPPGR